LGIANNGFPHLSVTAQRFCKLHLTQRVAFGREKSCAADHNTFATSPESGDSKMIEIIEELDALGASSERLSKGRIF
jgi:hypothetical protein